MPESTKTVGRMAGSAAGARKRTAIWATVNAPKSASGTASVWTVMSVVVFATYIA